MQLNAYSPGQPAVSSSTVVGNTRDALDKRYGPQPGDGRPPRA